MNDNASYHRLITTTIIIMMEYIFMYEWRRKIKLKFQAHEDVPKSRFCTYYNTIIYTYTYRL